MILGYTFTGVWGAEASARYSKIQTNCVSLLVLQSLPLVSTVAITLVMSRFLKVPSAGLDFPKKPPWIF